MNKVKQWVESQKTQDEVKALKELIQEWETGGVEDVEERFCHNIVLKTRKLTRTLVIIVWSQ